MSAPGFVLPDDNQNGYPIQQQHAPQLNAQASYPSYQVPYPTQQTAMYPPAHQSVPYPHQPFPAPIQQQPGYAPQAGVSWYQNTDFAQYLRNASSFHVKQKVELLEALVGWETENKYTVKDNAGNKVFYVGEETDCLMRQFGGKHRSFNLLVKDSRGHNVLNYERPCDCSFMCCCGLGACGDTMTVSTANGIKLGSIREECSIIYPGYKINDASGRTVLKVQGPLCPMAFFGQNLIFRVYTMDGISVGTISKDWSGLVRELFTDADYFSMSFPRDLDPSIKAVLMGALFLIDFGYFESTRGKQGGRRLFG